MITTTLVVVGYMTYATMFRYCLAINALTFLPFTVFCVYRYLQAGESFFLLMVASSIVWQTIVGSKALKVTRSVVGEIEARERLHDEMKERKVAEDALRESQDSSQRLAIMLQLICDNVPDLIWAKDTENRYIFVNAALCESILDCKDTSEPLGKTFDDYVQRERERHEDDPEWFTYGQYSQDIDRHTLYRDEPTTFEESGNIRGKFVHFDVHQSRLVNAQGELIGTVGCARDITERKAAEMQVQHLAHHDVLTDLPNRVLLSARMEQSLALARRDRTMLALLFIDLDLLKPVNDAYGHDVGDWLLKEVANRLRAVLVRETDTAARFGGDEFVVLLPRINKRQDAGVVAQKIHDALAQPFSLGWYTVNISASIGISLYPYDGDDVESLLRNADAAMYSVKHTGRNGYRFCGEQVAVAGDDQVAI
jgi:diguanylate cyclase (GGDEF)-like protein